MKFIKKVFLWPDRLAKNTDLWLIVIFLFIPACFLIDRHFNLYTQWVLGAIGWWLLLVGLKSQSTLTKILLIILVGLATIIEFNFSMVLHWYTYRLGNVPPWIPPGHGLIFLSAILWSRNRFAVRHTEMMRILVTLGALIYACWGLLSHRHDIIGYFAMLIFLIWLWLIGNQKGRFYAMMFFLVCYLEICGVTLGAWSWGKYLPHTYLTEGNPPSGIVGGYGLMDLLAFSIAIAIYHSIKQPRRHSLNAARK
jgi:hypothetical protein